MTAERPSSWALAPFPLIVVAGFLAIVLPLPVLSQRVHDELGFSLLTAGLVVGAQSLGTILTRQWAGALTDRRGPRHAAMLGLPLTTVASLLHLLSAFVNDPAASLAVLVLGRVVMGPAESLFLTGAMTWAIGRLGAGRAGLVMTWQGIALFLAIGLGAPVGLWLMRSHGFAAVAAASAAMSLVALAIALPIAPTAPTGRGGGVSFLTVIGLIWRQGAVLGLSVVPQAMLGAFVALHFAALGWEGAGLTLTGFGAGVILVRAALSWAPDRLGGARVALVSLLAEAAGMALVWAAPFATVAVLGAVLAGAGFSLVYPSMGVEVIRRVPESSRGLALGSFSAFLDLALGLSGPLGGLVAGLAGIPAVFLITVAGCLGGALLLAGNVRARA